MAEFDPGPCIACGHPYASHDWLGNWQNLCVQCECDGYVGEGDYEGVIMVTNVKRITWQAFGRTDGGRCYVPAETLEEARRILARYCPYAVFWHYPNSTTYCTREELAHELQA